MSKNIIIYFSFHGSPTGKTIQIPHNVSLYFSCLHGEEADDADPLSEIFEGTFHNAVWSPPDWRYRTIESKINEKSAEIIQPSGVSYDYELHPNDSGHDNSGVGNYVLFIFENTPSDGYTVSQINGSLTGAWSELIKSNYPVGEKLKEIIKTKSMQEEPMTISDLIQLISYKYQDYNIKLVFSICRQQGITGTGKKIKNKKRMRITKRKIKQSKNKKRKQSIRRK